ncbi:MAG: histidine phosphatase family protein, partial [Clostridiales bacterium]|nr:histidine phosphatase family protein [Clostridiales bacterium]
MKILVVRHGETDWNNNNLVLGRNDVDLNEIGIKQAQELRDNFPDQIHHVFSSPLKRAAMTASIVCE